MDDLRVDIPLDFRFMFVNTHAEVITGKQEGVFAWIAINYVLGKFDHVIGREYIVYATEVSHNRRGTAFSVGRRSEMIRSS